jgi:hypothetical protein
VVADDLPDATSVVPPENPPKEPSKRRFEPAMSTAYRGQLALRLSVLTISS